MPTTQFIELGEMERTRRASTDSDEGPIRPPCKRGSGAGMVFKEAPVKL